MALPQYHVLSTVPDLAGELRPILPNACNRYLKTPQVSLKGCIIQPGAHLRAREPEPSYLPPSWSSHIHPEGQLYFAYNGSLRIVTESYLYDAKVLLELRHWVKQIEAMLMDEEIILTNEMELFVQLDEDGCAYYLVDGLNRTVFWAEAVDSDSLGLPLTVSQTHQKIALEEQYWAHVEHFPMHFGGLSVALVDELINTFSHGLVDHMTSNVSTFQFSKTDCEAYLKVLKVSRNQIHDGRQTCLVARLLSSIAQNKFNVHHGEEHCRLSRDQSILDEYRPQTSSKLASLLTMRLSDDYLTRLNDVFVDRLVHVEPWRALMSHCISEWRHNSQVAFAMLLILSTLFVTLSLPIIGWIAFVLFFGSLLSSLLLLFRYNTMKNSISAEGHYHLSSIYSDNHGFKRVAILFSLPASFSVWGMAAFVGCVIFEVFEMFGALPAVLLSLATTVVIVSFLQITSVYWLPSFSLRFISFKSKKDVEDIV